MAVVRSDSLNEKNLSDKKKLGTSGADGLSDLKSDRLL